MRHRLLALVLAVLLLVPFTPVAHAAAPDAYSCLHPDVAVSANGQLLSSGTQIANDGGMAHAGTGLAFTFQARTFNPTIDLCNLRITDARTWQVDNWPCEKTPTKPARTQSLSWSVYVPLDCKFIGSPNLLTVSLTNGKGSAAASVMITTTQPGGLVKTERLDLRGRMTSLSVAQSGSPLRTMTSAYDAADNTTRSEDSVAGKSSYSYDPLNRLTAVCYGVGQCTDDASDYIRYDYDANGNRTWEKRPSGSTWSLYGPGNELQASITAPANYPLDVPTSRGYTYDPDGNLTFDGTTTSAARTDVEVRLFGSAAWKTARYHLVLASSVWDTTAWDWTARRRCCGGRCIRGRRHRQARRSVLDQDVRIGCDRVAFSPRRGLDSEAVVLLDGLPVGVRGQAGVVVGGNW